MCWCEHGAGIGVGVGAGLDVHAAVGEEGVVAGALLVTKFRKFVRKRRENTISLFAMCKNFRVIQLHDHDRNVTLLNKSKFDVYSANAPTFTRNISVVQNQSNMVG